MVYLTVTYGVKNLEQWKNVFEKGSERRTAAGCKSETPYLSPTDSNEVTVLYEWDSKENFSKFAANPELKNVSAAAGITSPPQIKFLE